MTKSRYEANPYVHPHHRHKWKLTEKKPATTGSYDWMGTKSEPEPMKLRRECQDCGVKQSASVEDESVIVPGYEAICDVDWKETTK